MVVDFGYVQLLGFGFGLVGLGGTVAIVFSVTHCFVVLMRTLRMGSCCWQDLLVVL